MPRLVSAKSWQIALPICHHAMYWRRWTLPMQALLVTCKLRHQIFRCSNQSVAWTVHDEDTGIADSQKQPARHSAHRSYLESTCTDYAGCVGSFCNAVRGLDKRQLQIGHAKPVR